MLGERTEGGGRVEALLKRKSLRDRHAKLTPETTVASADTVTASQPHAGLLPAGSPGRVRPSAVHSSPRRRQDKRSGDGSVEGATITSDSMPLTHTVGDELRLGGDLCRKGKRRPQWTLQGCAKTEEGGVAAVIGNDENNLKSCKSCALINVRGHESEMVERSSVWPASSDTREPDHGKGGGAPGRPSTCHAAALVTPGMSMATEACRSSCDIPGTVSRVSGCLARTCWWPVLVMLLALLLPSALGLPAVIRIGKCYPGSQV